MTTPATRAVPAFPAVLVTRPQRQAQALAKRIVQAGMGAVVFPTLEIVPVAPVRPAAGQYDCVVFISANAVEHGWQHAFGDDALPSGPRVAAIGEATATALRARGAADPLVPAETFDTESLLALPDFESVAGWRVLVVRGVGGREALAASLQARGATVDYLECYRRVRPDVDAAWLIEKWRDGGVDAVNAMSTETLSNLLALLGVGGDRLVAATPVFVPHSRIATAARALGVDRTVVYGGVDAGLVERLRAHFPQRMTSPS